MNAVLRYQPAEQCAFPWHLWEGGSMVEKYPNLHMAIDCNPNAKVQRESMDRFNYETANIVFGKIVDE